MNIDELTWKAEIEARWFSIWPGVWRIWRFASHRSFALRLMAKLCLKKRLAKLPRSGQWPHVTWQLGPRSHWGPQRSRREDGESKWEGTRISWATITTIFVRFSLMSCNNPGVSVPRGICVGEFPDRGAALQHDHHDATCDMWLFKVRSRARTRWCTARYCWILGKEPDHWKQAAKALSGSVLAAVAACQVIHGAMKESAELGRIWSTTDQKWNWMNLANYCHGTETWMARSLFSILLKFPVWAWSIEQTMTVPHLTFKPGTFESLPKFQVKGFSASCVFLFVFRTLSQLSCFLSAWDVAQSQREKGECASFGRYRAIWHSKVLGASCKRFNSFIYLDAF